MAEVPGDLASSIAPANYKAGEVAKERGARHAGQAHAANRQVKAVDEHGNTVDTEDADTAIFADAEGTGSQGRSLEEGASPEQQETPANGESGIIEDENGQLHLDIEA